MRRDQGIAGTDFGFNYRQTGTDQWGLRLDNTSIGIFDDIDNAGTIRYATTVNHGQLFCVVVQMTAGKENLIYVNGELAGSGEVSSGDWASFSGRLNHGALATTVNQLNGLSSPMLLYNEVKSADWIRQKYLDCARAVQFQTMYGVKESVANETAGFIGAGSSPYEILSGTWKISRDSEGRKNQECVANGVTVLSNSLYCATPTEAAFGSWQCSLIHQDTSQTLFMPIASDKAGRTGATQNGYQLGINSNENVTLARITNGAVASTFISSGNDFITPNVQYLFWIYRRYDGLFKLYILGGVYTSWTLIGSATDLTHTISNYSVQEFDSGDILGFADQQNGHCYAKYLGALEPWEV
jgi:hypothetical protein